MGRLVFKIDETLRSIVEHAASHAPGTCYGEPIERHSVFLVKDRGVYLMSAAAESQKTGKQAPEDVVVVKYAEHHDPKQGETWDLDRLVCGGDDFAEPIDVKAFKAAIDEGAQEILIDLTATSLSVKSR